MDVLAFSLPDTQTLMTVCAGLALAGFTLAVALCRKSYDPAERDGTPWRSGDLTRG